MAKVFTIIPGLENMGALKTGGQGSVYKGRRIGEIITAIKLLPTPIINETEDDKNYRDFQNEVRKLKKVNEDPNPNVVKILSSGLSETGNFPFIEMEFIEGPDLEELLRVPHPPVFTIKEVIKVAEHLSSALAHCHRKEVKHGDIKSNNVKFNIHTGNYVLLDFGLAVMSDEQRRTSLRQAGAIEFMAPEQNEGKMLFETDVYSFGIILFELLAGRVPFPLTDKSEHARNLVRVAHMENPLPDLLSLRQKALPEIWAAAKKDREMQVPEWLLQTIKKCLNKRPEERYRNGLELYDFVFHNSISADAALVAGDIADEDISSLSKEQLQQFVWQYKRQLQSREADVLKLQEQLVSKPATVGGLAAPPEERIIVKHSGVSSGLFAFLLIVTIVLGAFSGYAYLKYFQQPGSSVAQNNVSGSADSTGSSTPDYTPPATQREPEPRASEETTALPPPDTTAARPQPKPAEPQTDNPQGEAGDYIIQDKPEAADNGNSSGSNKYMVLNKAYFYNSPDEASRRNAYMVPSDKAVLIATDDLNGFVYVMFTNQLGQTSKGWLRKADLKPVN